MARFPFTATDNLPTSLLPRLPMTLTHGRQSLEISGLLDTGATINVLPYEIGLKLGAVWEEQTTVVPLAGNLARVNARALILTASHPQITSHRDIRLVFAWVQSDNVSILFGR